MATKNSRTTLALILCALFAALTAIFSAISIPLPFTPIPLNLATLSVFLSGGILGWKWGSISQIVYVLLGAIGLPVFHNFTGGVGILVGPTGGYIIGYILAAFLIGLLSTPQKVPTHQVSSYFYSFLVITAGCIACYALGTLWFMFLTGSNLLAALLSCVVPFLPGDLLKILAALFLMKRVPSGMTLSLR